MTQNSQARFLTFVDIHNAHVCAFFASIAAALTLFGFVSTSRAEHEERVVKGYYDDYGQYAYEPEPDVVVEYAPPPPRVYTMYAPPYPGAIWVQPHWYWDDYQWVWIDGYYVAPRPGYVYVQPRWTVSFGLNVFLGGYFYPAHSHVVYWNSYNHYWWHRPHAYHHYFHNRRPYYYHDHRRGRYYDRGRTDRDYHHNNGRGNGHHDNGVRDHGRGEGRDGHGQGRGRGNANNGQGNGHGNGHGNNGQGNGHGSHDHASGQGRGNGHDMNRPQAPRQQFDRSPSRVDRSPSHEFRRDFAMRDPSRGGGRSMSYGHSMSHSRGGQSSARGGRR